MKDKTVTWSLRQLLIAAFAIPIVCLLLLGVKSLTDLAETNERLQTIYEDRVVPLEQLKSISDSYAVRIIDAVNKANAGLIDAQRIREQVVSAQQDIKNLWASYKATKLTEKESRLADEAERLFDDADRNVARLLDALDELRGNVQGELDHFDGALYESIDPISDKVAELIDLQLSVAKNTYEASLQQETRSRILTLTFVALALLISVGSALLILRSVRKKLGDDPSRVNEVVTRVADGDLTDESGATRLISGSVMEKLRTMVRKLAEILANVANTSSSLKETSRELVSSASEAMGAAQQQQSETEQVATAVNEMSASVTEVARNASQTSEAVKEAGHQVRQARELTSGARKRAGEMSDSMSLNAELIARLAEDSERIGSVLDVIGGIAEQTNLLALNAAIEAARAGEQGRGFAVVADEVRSLAQRTNDSTREIQTVIESVQAGSRKAVTAMNESGRQALHTRDGTEQALTALQAIETAMERAMDMNAQIASAAEEQSSVAEEVNQNITRVSALSEQTVTMNRSVEETGRSLEAASNQLKNAIEYFKFNNTLSTSNY